MFLAKVAAAATAIGLTVVFLNSVVGLVGPLALAPGAPSGWTCRHWVSTRHAAGQCSRHRATVEGRTAAELPHGLGMVVGVVKHGERRVSAYGTARPDSVYQIGSITKTFTGSSWRRWWWKERRAWMSRCANCCPQAQFRNRWDAKSRCSIWRRTTPLAGDARRLQRHALSQSGCRFCPLSCNRHPRFCKKAWRRREATRRSSTATWDSPCWRGACARAGAPYAELVAQRITGPLGMRDTAVGLPPEGRQRLIQAYDSHYAPVRRGNWTGLHRPAPSAPPPATC